MFQPLCAKCEKGWVFAQTKAQSNIYTRLCSDVKKYVSPQLTQRLVSLPSSVYTSSRSMGQNPKKGGKWSKGSRQGDPNGSCVFSTLPLNAVRRKFSWGGFSQWHMVVICIGCEHFVTSQFDVIFTFPNQRFGEVC